MSDAALVVIGCFLFIYTIVHVVTDWTHLDKSATVLKFVLPIWLTIAVAPFLFLFDLYLAYNCAFTWVDFATGDPTRRRIAKLALMRRLNIRTFDVAALNLPWARRLIESPSVRDGMFVLSEWGNGTCT